MVRKVDAPDDGGLDSVGGNQPPPNTDLSARTEGVAKQIIPDAESRTDAGFKHKAIHVQGNNLYQSWFS